MKKFKSLVSICIVVTFLCACSTPPKKISASYVSPVKYNGYTCEQIRSEIIRVSQHLQLESKKQKKESTKDSWAMGIGLILLWPALFFLIGEDRKEEVAQLKGEYKALETLAIEKNCQIEDIKIDSEEDQEDEELIEHESI